MDDGLPITGHVIAAYLNDVAFPWHDAAYAAGGTGQGLGGAGSPTTCFDDNVNPQLMHYSIEINGGAGPNCALIFQFQ